jgi:hypothetical protein
MQNAKDKLSRTTRGQKAGAVTQAAEAAKRAVTQAAEAAKKGLEASQIAAEAAKHLIAESPSKPLLKEVASPGNSEAEDVLTQLYGPPTMTPKVVPKRKGQKAGAVTQPKKRTNRKKVGKPGDPKKIMEAKQSFFEQWGRGAKDKPKAKAEVQAKAKDKPKAKEKVQPKPKESASEHDADNEGRSIAGLCVL